MKSISKARIARWIGVTAGAAVLPAALLAAPAYASGLVFKSGQNIVATMSTGMSHNVTVAPSGSTAVVISAVGESLSAGAGCIQSGTAVFCPLDTFTTVIVNGAEFADTITKTANVRGDLRGGSGNDTINAGPSPAANVIDGGFGQDIINGGPSNDVFNSGPGNDRFSGGGGNDVASYINSTAGVTVTIDNVFNDGVPGEQDSIQTDVELIYGSNFADTLTGSSLANIFLGFAGDDRLNGGPGDDTLVGDVGKDTVRGEGGNDRLEVKDGVTGEIVDGDIGSDTCLVDATDIPLSCETILR